LALLQPHAYSTLVHINSTLKSKDFSMISRLTTPVFALAVVIATISMNFANAQGTDPVLARVDGVEIRQSDLAVAEADIGQSLPPQAQGDARRDALLSYLIDVTLIARAGEAKKIDQSPNFPRKLAYARNKVLMETFLEQESKAAVSEKEMRKLYDESVTKAGAEQEVHARHILVDSEDKAKEIITQLKGGADFAKLAKENSKDPGASDGGDLGYFSKDQMVPDFAEAAFKLDKGKISEAPVKTQFGFHVIKIEDKREKKPPTYDQVKDQIQSFVMRKAQAEMVMKLREGAKIERLTQSAAPAAPAGEKKK
jgi:peptidyl-prolyl cis-trans isomerase C